MVVHHPKGGCAILQPPPGEDGTGGPQLVAVTLTRGGESPIQGLELGIQAVQGAWWCGLWAGQPHAPIGLEQWTLLGPLLVAGWHGGGRAIGEAAPGQGAWLGSEIPRLQ